MDTLNQANPFFIRCIKSNSNKIPNEFDEETVQRQLRYTGMLETVRIRQAGFNVRLNYEEFIQLYRMLLPKGLLSSQSDVRDFLLTLNLNRDNYQLGTTKVFLRESEKIKLDIELHQQIITSITTIQKWFRACLERRKFLRIKNAVVQIQSFWRMAAAQKFTNNLRSRVDACVHIQSMWRTYKQQSWFKKLRSCVVTFQSYVRGHQARKTYRALKEKKKAPESPCKIETTIDSSISYSKRKLTPNKRSLKTPEVFESAENSERKGSLESLASLRSYESQSSESHYSENLNSKPIPSTRTKRTEQSPSVSSSVTNTASRLSSISRRTDSSSTGYSDGDTDGETPNAVQSAPPIFTTVPSFPSPNVAKCHQNITNSPDIWRKRPDFPPQKSTVTRSPNVGQYKNLTESLLEHARLERLNEASNFNVKIEENSRQQDLRRQNSEGEVSTGIVRKVVSMDTDVRKEKIEPDVPVRSARRNRPSREVQCRSMGESVTEIAPIESRHLFLGTIKESDLNKSSSVWSKTDEISRSVTDWPVNKNEGTYKVQQVGKRGRSNAIPSLELRRRNSDPATKVSGLDEKSGQDTSPNDLKLAPGMNLLEWKGNNLFTLAGHRFRKVARFAKDDVCVCCHEKMDAFVTQGYKCVDCKQLYHVKCIQNGGVLRMPCILANTPNRRKNRKPRTAYDTAKAAVVSKFSLTGTSAFSDSTDKIISDAKELALMQDFITKKIYIMEGQEEGKKPSEVDRVFKQALRKFKDDLVITYSVAIQQGVEGNIKYTDLIANFLHVMETVCKQENTREDFPVTMGVNAFRGFMNEFMTIVKTEAPEKQSKSKRKKEKKRKQEEPIRHGNHMFMLTIINIPTACEVCTSFFMWPIERGLVCQSKF